MELEHSFTVPAGIERAWSTLLDVQEIAPCMPGATLESVHDDEFTGKVKVKVGPITMTYSGRARFRDRDDAAHTLVIEAAGTEARGSGSASATVYVSLQPGDESTTQVAVRTDLNVTGRPAQFGRGVLGDVSARLIGQFAECLAGKMTQSEGAEAVAPADDAMSAERAVPSGARKGQPAPEAIDLVATAGMPMLKRLAPVLIGAAALIIIWVVVKH